MTRAGIIGATGYTGAELVRILHRHPEVELTVLTSRQHIGVRMDEIYPAFAGVADYVCEAYDPDTVCEKADIFFTALPHKLPMDIIPGLVERGKRVVDLSADFRFRDIHRYESAYQPHAAKSLAAKAVYGLSEIYRDEIKTADVTGNPGCYPTSILLPLIPLIRAGLIEPETLIADAKSGVSGAGRSPSLAVHFSEVNESFKAYKVAAHRHTPEMNEVLTREASREIRLTFVPHLIPLTRGMLSTIYAAPAGKTTAADVRACLADFYRDRPFVRICPEGRIPNTLHVRGSNFCDIGCAQDPSGRIILISAIDNLVKGASGQAVQNMNIMLGLAETAGLDGVPYPF